MNFFGHLSIYRTESWIQIGSIYEPGQKLTLKKNEQNPLKSIKILWFWTDFTILCDFDVFGILLWIWVVEATQSRKNQNFRT